MNSRALFLTAFVVTGGMIAWQDFTRCKMLPWPPRFIFAGITYGLLDLLAGFLGDLPGVIAIGITLAFVVNTVTPVTPGKKGPTGVFRPSCHFNSKGQPIPVMPGATPQPYDYKYLLQNTPTTNIPAPTQAQLSQAYYSALAQSGEGTSAPLPGTSP